MKIIRNISSINPSMCSMTATGFFGDIKGKVEYYNSTYNVYVNGEIVGSCTDFYGACNMLLEDLKIFKTVCV